MEGVQRTLATLKRLYGGDARGKQQLARINNDDVERSYDSSAEESIDGDETTMKGEPRQANPRLPQVHRRLSRQPRRTKECFV